MCELLSQTSGEEHVVDLHEDINCTMRVLEDVLAWIRFRSTEPKYCQQRIDDAVPLTGSLLKSIEGPQ